MDPLAACEHEWRLILTEDSWSGPRRLSVCPLCHATLREYLPSPRKRSRPPSSTKGFGDYVRERVRNSAAPEPVGTRPDAEPGQLISLRTPETRLTSGSPSSGQVPQQRD